MPFTPPEGDTRYRLQKSVSRNGQSDHQYVMMSFMEPDATGHRTQDTGQPSRPVFVPAPPETQDTAINGVPLPLVLRPAVTGHGTQDVPDGTPRDTPRNVPPALTVSVMPDITPRQNTGHGTPAPARDTEQDVPQQDATGTGQEDGTSRGMFRKIGAKVRDVYRDRQDAVRSTEEALRIAQQNAERDAQIARDAVSRETTSRRRRTSKVADAPEIAPIPPWMAQAQVWAERIGGTLLKLSPLIASGYFTYDVGTEAPLNMNAFVAIFLVGGLEGSLWYLNRLREKFKLENDSTASISAVIFGIIGLIFVLLSGHAIWKSAGAEPIMITLPWFKDDLTGQMHQVPLDQLVPGIAVALMSAIGVFIWAKEATYKHRAKLRELGQIDPRAPRISAGAWVFTVWESFWSLRHSFKYRITQSPTDDWRHWKAAGKPKIWPIPEGFRWDGKRLMAIPMDELRDMAERNELLARITGRDAITEQQDVGQQDTIVVPSELGTGRPAGRRELNGGTPPPVVPPAGGTQNGTAGGTSRGTQDGTHGTSRTGQNGAGPQNGNGTHGNGNGTDPAGGNGTQDGDGTQDVPQDTDGTLTDQERADVLKYGAHLLVITEAFPDWRTSAKLPAVRKINAAIDTHRKDTEGPNAKFNSLDVSGKVQAALSNMRRDPSLLDTIRDLEGKP